VTAKPVMLKVVVPVLVRVTVWAVLVISTGWLEKARLVGERLAEPVVLVPVPERLTVWGLPLALSVMLSEAARLPLADGVKVTLIVQMAPAATLDPQLLVWAKSLALVPETAMLVTLKAALPELVRVIVWAVLVAPTDWFPKARLVGETLATRAVPVPERLTFWGLPVALSVMVSEAARLPLAEGLKVTLIVQVAPAATELPQLLVWAKSLALVPETAMLVTLKAALPELVRVIVWAVLVAPTVWLAKVRLVGERLVADVVPVPLILTLFRLEEKSSLTVRSAVRVPVAVGWKVALIVQLAPAVTLEPQLLVCAKSLGFVPVSAMLVMLKAALPERVTFWGLPVALSVMFNVLVRVPGAEGLKVT
jgi:hypothetical protein